jgi:diguanylate cyclase (GGDEF)-like protein/PAS domain S-box-containing protein
MTYPLESTVEFPPRTRYIPTSENTGIVEKRHQSAEATTASAASLAESASWLLRLIRLLRAPVLALAIAFALDLLSLTPLEVPNRAWVLLVFVVFAAYHWRLRDGLTSGAVALLYALSYYAVPGTRFQYSPETIRLLIGTTLAAVALITVLVRSKKKMNRALEAEQKAHARLTNILESITDGFIAIDRSWRLTYMNAEGEKLLGRSREELVGRSVWEAVPEIEDSIFQRHYRKAMELREATTFEARSLVVDKYFEVHAYPAEDGIAVYFSDVTEQRIARTRLQSSEERYRELFENANDLLYTHDLVGQFTSVNNSCVTVTGYNHGELLAMNLSDLVAPDHLDRARQNLLQKLQGHGAAMTYELEIVARDGRRVPVEVSTRLIHENGKPVAVQGIARDISERKRAEAALRNMSLTDPLTGVYNRRGAITLADQQLKVAQRLGRNMLLIYADLDHLKIINDTYGHTAGDTALVEIAEALQETFRESDIIARIGGDEFVVLAMETADSSEAAIRRRVMDALAARNAISMRPYDLSVSLGIARFDADRARAFDDLMSEADRKMYEDKRVTRIGDRGSAR